MFSSGFSGAWKGLKPERPENEARNNKIKMIELTEALQKYLSVVPIEEVGEIHT